MDTNADIFDFTDCTDLYQFDKKQEALFRLRNTIKRPIFVVTKEIAKLLQRKPFIFGAYDIKELY